VAFVYENGSQLLEMAEVYGNRTHQPYGSRTARRF
jgi:hypothetical protein